MSLLLAVGLGGACGAMARYTIVRALEDSAVRGGWPLGTLLVNMLGGLALGALYGLAQRSGLPELIRVPIAYGLLGGLTTFSAFAWEVVTILQRGQPGQAAVYIIASVLLCTALAWAGLVLVR